MSEPHEDPRVREVEPTTATLEEMITNQPAPATPRDVEEVTDSGDAAVDEERGEP
jgi:hypothetical protein